MIDLEEYKKTALITDRSGMSANPDECVYEFGEVEYEGKVFDTVNCKTHGHGGMREKVTAVRIWDEGIVKVKVIDDK